MVSIASLSLGDGEDSSPLDLRDPAGEESVEESDEDESPLLLAISLKYWLLPYGPLHVV